MKAAYAIRQLVSMLEEFGPEHLSAIRGLSDDELDVLEHDIGCRLCVGHRTFMAHLGATPKCAMGPFLYNYDFSARTVREHYQILDEDERASSWTFWAYVGDTPTPLYLHVQSLTLEDPPIGSLVLDRVNRESMWNDIIFKAYLFLLDDKFEKRGLSGWLWDGRNISRTEASGLFAKVQHALDRIGFEPWIDMANFQTMMRRGDTIVWFGRTGTRPHPDEWNFSISGPDPRELREVREILADNVGAVERPVRNR